RRCALWARAACHPEAGEHVHRGHGHLHRWGGDPLFRAQERAACARPRAEAVRAHPVDPVRTLRQSAIGDEVFRFLPCPVACCRQVETAARATRFGYTCAPTTRTEWEYS